MSIRLSVARQLDPSLRIGFGLSATNKVLIAFIFLSTLLAVLETEPTVQQGNGPFFLLADCVFVAIFGAEYLARLWSCVENPLVGSRLRYAFRFWMLLDLLIILTMALPLVDNSIVILRMFRVLRVLRIARLGRFSSSINLLLAAVHSRRYELGVTAVFALVLMLITSSLLYLVEGVAQPEAFGSIPRAMWWSIATLTTVGYGDVYPVTPLGKSLAALTAFAGIGLIAMPTGVMASAFSEAIQASKLVHQAGQVDETPATDDKFVGD